MKSVKPVDAGGSYKWIVLLITTVGSFMSPLDGSIVNIALPSITSGLHIDFTTAIWIPTIYLLSMGALLLSFGRLSDIRGRKALFIIGFIVFTSASAFCGASQTGAQLILFRAIQGAGAALIGVSALAIVTDTFPGKERGKAIGINTMAVYVGLSVGPSLGGFLVQGFGWRSIFYVNVPIGLTVIILALRKLRESSASRSTRQRFDLAGAVTFSAGLAALLAALTLGENYGWLTPPVVGLYVASGASLLSFFLIERRKGDDAMLNISLLLHNRLFAAANLSALLNYASYFGVGFFMSFYLQRALGYLPVFAGVILLSMPVIMAILSPLSGWLSDRLGSRLLSTLGMAIISAGLFLLTTLNVHSSSLDILIRLLILGLGMGLFSSPNTSAVMGSVEKKNLGVASATLSTMRFVGQSVSLVLMGAVMSTAVPPETISQLLTGTESALKAVAAEAFVAGLHKVFLVSGLIALVATFTSSVRGGARA